VDKRRVNEVLLVRAGPEQIPTNLGTSWHGSEGKNLQLENQKARLEIAE